MINTGPNSPFKAFLEPKPASVSNKSAALNQLNKYYPSQDYYSPQQPQPRRRINIKTLALAVAAVGAVLIGVSGYIRNKKYPTVSLGDIKFRRYKNGLAYSRATKKPFSGTIEDVLPNGDNIVMKFKKGVIQSSEVSGSANFTKTYEGSGKSRRVVIEDETGSREIILERIVSEVKNQQRKISEFLSKPKKYTLEQSVEIANNTIYKTQKQSEKIERVIIEKERLAQKALRAKQRAEKLSKIPVLGVLFKTEA